jgi:succinylglutamate desuccinylase
VQAAIESDALQALACGDFGVLAQRFLDAGFAIALPGPGMLHIKSRSAAGDAVTDTVARASVLLSVGVHGDETGPIDMLAQLLDRLSRQPRQLAVDLMVCVGNIGAIGAGRRYIDADLNRMFRLERGDLAGAVEAARADQMIAATMDFFSTAKGGRWHLDLHTAIRASKYPTFAIVPELIAPPGKAALSRWLGQAGIEAIIINPTSSGTYSHFSAQHCGAVATTIELGRVGVLGQNDLALFFDAALALDGLLRGVAPPKVTSVNPGPQVFTVAQQIVKQSDAFSMAFDGDTHNFTALSPGAVIATDGDTVHRVGQVEELVVFPNPDVRVGLRAALMVVRQGGDAIETQSN